MGCLARALLMLVLPFAFFWVPVPGLGGFIAGVVGGYLSGSPGRAILSATIPFFVITALIVGLGFHVGLPAIGSVIGGIAFVFLVVHDLTLLAGALAGGLLAAQRRLESPRRIHR